MQFVKNGPDIPDALLHAHEDGQVVFFCGAGISYPAGLPGFEGLVKNIYAHLGTTPEPIEQELIKAYQFDAALNQLERRLPSQRVDVRTALKEVLKPNFRRRGALETQISLLRLGRNRAQKLRLVTTNFDRIFDRAAKKNKENINIYTAPTLPIPKNSRWDGLVYLHGALPIDKKKASPDNLVLSSGDFGLAYLTERWASRFVTELFRNYIVCFVGYSINDPILRYMMDALAADEMQGEKNQSAYAFGHYESGEESIAYTKWKSKGVNPILYEATKKGKNHDLLHNTLKVWGETYRDGSFGKNRIVSEYSRLHPSESTKQDDFTSRMLWALSDKTGLPSKIFSEAIPTPSLDWLSKLSEKAYSQGDLVRFGVQPNHDEDHKLQFSLMDRPTPYNLSPWMSPISQNPYPQEWDKVMQHLANWLTRHLGDPKLIIWITKQRGTIHPGMLGIIRNKLDSFLKLKNESNVDELGKIKAESPMAIPDKKLENLWRLLISDRVTPTRSSKNFYAWLDRLNSSDSLTLDLKIELRQLLSPVVSIKEAYRSNQKYATDNEHTTTSDLIKCEVKLSSLDVSSFLSELRSELWEENLPLLINDFESLLLDTLELQVQLDLASNKADYSHWHLPSIQDHPQNRFHENWVILIELLRDSWVATANHDPKSATNRAILWYTRPYPVFKRLAFFAASHDNCVDSRTWVHWLTKENSWWLWSVNTQREVMRLLVLQGNKCNSDTLLILEDAILRGPHKSRFREDLPPNDLKNITDHLTWVLLAKLKEGGASLGKRAKKRSTDLTDANPRWHLKANERDEFSYWMSSSGDPDYDEENTIEIAPRKRSDIVNWIKIGPTGDRIFHEDTWGETCKQRFFHSFLALLDLANEGHYPAEHWRRALQAWSSSDKIELSWNFAAPTIAALPDNIIQEISHAVASWAEKASTISSENEATFINLAERIFSISLDGPQENDAINAALNHPVGITTKMLINLWLKLSPNDDDGISLIFRKLFSQLCDTSKDKFRHGRVLLASRAIPLFRVDPPWFKANIIPLLNWQANAGEAKRAWESFLWSPRLYQPLFAAFKNDFFDTASHYNLLGEFGQQYIRVLTAAALHQLEGYTTPDFRKAISKLNQEGLETLAKTLQQEMEQAGEQKEEYWRNRMKPFLHDLWPKERSYISTEIAESFARLSIATGSEFPSAFSAIEGWLQPLSSPDYTIKLVNRSNIGTHFAIETLNFLDAIIGEPNWISDDLENALDTIARSNPALQNNQTYKRLQVLVQTKRH